MLSSKTIDLGRRLSGLILHPTSLPGRFGIGDLGPDACHFVDRLATAGQHLWQVLPLGPTHESEFSPYSSLSAFAGNPLLISPELLVGEGCLDFGDLPQATAPDVRVDFPAAAAAKQGILRKACGNFRERAGALVRDRFAEFCERSAAWLDDFALFMALRGHFHGTPWYRWPADARRRDADTLRAARQTLGDELFFHRFLQFEFARQWDTLRAYAHARRLGIVGDVPIYVAHDAVDVWAHPHYFLLDGGTGELAWEAGVPPDDVFSDDGQRWGNPLYDWDKLEQDGYAWWNARLATVLSRRDVARLDHFRGFEAFWAIPRAASSAREGHWRAGPGARFLTALRAALAGAERSPEHRAVPGDLEPLREGPEKTHVLEDHMTHRFPGDLPLFVEDLGFITPAVEALRDQFGLPGIRVAQFGFDGEPTNCHLPRRFPSRCVAYTGTHDCDTTIGWYASASGRQRQNFHDSVGAIACNGLRRSGVHWDAIRLVWSSAADWTLAPLQDLLGLDGSARMNVPGTLGAHNWSWRCRPEDLEDAAWDDLAHLTRAQDRGVTP